MRLKQSSRTPPHIPLVRKLKHPSPRHRISPGRLAMVLVRIMIGMRAVMISVPAEGQSAQVGHIIEVQKNESVVEGEVGVGFVHEAEVELLESVEPADGFEGFVGGNCRRPRQCSGI